MTRWQFLSWLLWPLDVMNGVNELLFGCAHSVGPTITTPHYQKQTYFFLFCFQLITWLEFSTNICPGSNLGMFVASERRLTDIWVKQSMETVCLFFKCQISSIVFQISIILDLPFSFNSLVATLPKDTTENFNLLSVVRLTRLCERVERFTVVARVIYLDKAYNALYTLQVDSTLFSSLNHSGCLPSLCERGTFWSCVLNAVSIYTKLS